MENPLVLKRLKAKKDHPSAQALIGLILLLADSPVAYVVGSSVSDPNAEPHRSSGDSTCFGEGAVAMLPGC